MVLSFCLICTVVVALASFIMTPLYRGTTTIAVEGEGTDMVTSYEKASTENTSYDIFENYLVSQMTIIRSRSIARKVFDEFKLGESKRYRRAKDPLKAFLDDIFLERVKLTRIIKVSVDNPDPKTAADLANRLAEVYAEDNLTRRALTFIRNQRMASLNNEYQRLQNKLDSLSNQYGPKHPEMIALREEIETMGRRIRNQQNTIRGAASGTPNALDNQALLEKVLIKIQEGSVISSSRMNNIIIADRAIVPKEREQPKRLLNILIAFVGGLFGGVFLAFFVDYLDDSIKTEDDLKRHVGEFPLLGSVFIEPHALPSKGVTARPGSIDHLLASNPESPSAEAYRLVRMGVLWAARNKPMKDVAIVSTGPEEGKTTVASNLAISLSQTKMKVLLVDTDMRKGRIHDSYSLTNEKGLGLYLTGELKFDEVVQKTEIPNLFIVTCGKSMIDASQLFSSPAMSEFIREARARFDIIVYDTPPITIISDTSILLSQIDSALFVIRSGITSARTLSKALYIFKKSNTRMIGVVFNAANPSECLPNYYKYYHRR